MVIHVAMAHPKPPPVRPRTWPRNTQPPKEFAYQDVRLRRDEQLGTGSYGMVYKATVDDLVCAAKILHMTFFQLNDLNPATPSRMMNQFHRECELLSSIRHPCIVQFLATYQDPETRLPVLLMELMDESLTKFLESSVESQTPILYHIQINICHDVAMAVSYLHSHGIIHRDLSSNNILMIARSRAKVTDFGMSKLTDVNPRMTPLTQCPGTMVYMSPEALRTPPSYSEKLDIFSLGVLMLQIVTCNFPSPKDPKKTIRDRRLGVIEMPVPELERRQEDIDKMRIDHPLRHMTLNCLADEPTDRSRAGHICRQLAILKEQQLYFNSVAEEQGSYATLKRLEREVLARDEEIQRLRDEVQQKACTIAMVREDCQEEKERALAARDRTIASLKEDCERMHRELMELRMDSHGTGNFGSPMSHQNDSILGSQDISQVMHMNAGHEPVDFESSDSIEDQLNLDAPDSSMWYHGAIDRATACQRLEKVGKPGAYLVRESGSERGLVLSFLDRESRFHHFMIVRRAGRYNIGGNIWFSSLSKLLGFHSKYSSVVERHSERLDVCVPPPQPVPLPSYIH